MLQAMISRAKCLGFEVAFWRALYIESVENMTFTNFNPMPHLIMWSWYTSRWWVGCCTWYGEEGTGWSHSPLRPPCCTNVPAPRQRPVYQLPRCCI